MKKIKEAKLEFRRHTLSIVWEGGHIQHLPINFIQKKCNQASPIVGFELHSPSTLLLFFSNNETANFNPLEFIVCN